MKSKVFGTLFALPFFSVGVWMLWSIGSTLIEAWQMDSWVQIEAQLTDGGYETHSGDDSSTYEAFASYHYEFAGRRYAGNRVSLNTDADNIGDYQRDIGHNLQAALRSGNAILVYVNADNPADAVIDRGVRWGLLGFKSIFLFVFGGIGLGLLIGIWSSPPPKDTSLPQFQQTPWLRNAEWQTASIRSTSKSSMQGAWVFATLWGLISAPIPFLLYDEIVEKENYLAIIGALFPIIGVGLLIWALRRTLEWTRFGATPLTMDPFPGSIGGHVGGAIELRLPFAAEQTFALTLTCIHSYTTGSGDDRSQRESALWQDKLIAHTEPSASGTRLAFRFDVPQGLQESGTEKNDSYYLWRLNLRAELPGTDLDRDYELPVFATASRSRFLPDMAVRKSRDMQRAVDDMAVRERVNLKSTSTGKRLYYPLGRYFASAIGGLIVGSIFAAAGWFLIVHAEQRIFGSIFGGVGALITFSFLYMLLNSLEVIQKGLDIITVRRLLGMPIRRQRMQKAAVRALKKVSSFKTQSGNRHLIYYSIHALDRDGNKLMLGEGFRGENEANAAIRLFASEFDLLQAANDSLSIDATDLTKRIA